MNKISINNLKIRSMKSRKYILTDETKTIRSVVVHRIKAVKDFADVKKGDLGGWVENESNLSQEGDCWLYDYTAAYGGTIICGNGKIENTYEGIDPTYKPIIGNAHICEYIEPTYGNKD